MIQVYFQTSSYSRAERNLKAGCDLAAQSLLSHLPNPGTTRQDFNFFVEMQNCRYAVWRKTIVFKLFLANIIFFMY